VTRVVHVVAAGEIGGAERMLVELARGRDDHAVALMSPSEALLAMLKGAGLRVHDRGRVREDPAAFLWRTLGPRDVAWVEDVLRRERAAVAHLHTFASQVVGTRAALRAGASVVRTEHSTRVYKDPSCWPFSRWSLARTDAVVAISGHVREVALARAPWVRPRLRVVRNGVDLGRFSPRETTRADADASAPPRFVLVGRLEPRKGVDLALEALARVPGARLDIVGDGEARAKLEALARDLGVAGRVRFLGFLEDPRAAIARSDAALCSSREEGLGVALLEAMAMARPVVGFAVGGVPEIVADGSTGLLAPSGDVAALAARMRDAASDRARLVAFGRAARTFVEHGASVESMRAAYADVYASVARAAPP
jgi:glycosyltransferase involved in cell wall biosynthesis